MKNLIPNLFTPKRSLTLGIAAFSLVLTCNQLSAATGGELLMSKMSASEMNKSVVSGPSLLKAVSKAVAESKEQAPEIVGVAMTKTRSLATQKEIVRDSILALGDYKTLSKGLIPSIVAAAIRATPCVSDTTADTTVGSVGCECAEEFTKVAIETVGSGASEKLITDITAAAIEANSGKCTELIVAAASGAAPQFGSSISELTGASSNPLVFGPNGVPLPSSFTVPSNAPGIVSATTNVLNN